MTPQKGTPTYITGLGDMLIKAQIADAPDITLDLTESLTNYQADGTATLLVESVQTTVGNNSIQVTTAASGDGITFLPGNSTTVDLSSCQTGIVKVNIYPLGSTASMKFFLRQGTNYREYTKTVTANQWNGVLLDVANPTVTSGTVNFTTISGIDAQVIASGNNFYVDGYYAFTTMDHVGQEQNVKVACLNEISVESKDTIAQLKCSDNSIVDEAVVATEVLLKAKVQDFAPGGQELLAGAAETTNQVTSLVLAETFSVPVTGPYTYTPVKASTMRVGAGYGIWVHRPTGEMFRESPDSTILRAGYFYVNPLTGVLTFSSSDAGTALVIDYDIVTSGKTFTITSNRTLQEFSLQFQVKSTNGKSVLYFFPRCKADGFSLTPAKDKYWEWNLNAQVLADTVTGKYYEVHTTQ